MELLRFLMKKFMAAEICSTGNENGLNEILEWKVLENFALG